MHTAESLQTLIDRFIQRSTELQQETHGRLPLTIADPEWPSACYQPSPANTDSHQAWQPVPQNNYAQEMFDRLEEALGYTIHPDIRTWYSSYWSDPVPAQCPDGDLSLLFIWNEKDCERLRGNLIGHLLNKQKLRHPPSIFFACTEPDGDHYLSVDNHTGEVWLELPGRPAIRKIAGSLSEFLTTLTPLPIPDTE